jgi:hypothetical protein
MGVKELENGENSSFGLRLGIPKISSLSQIVSSLSLDEDPMFMKQTYGRGNVGEGFSRRYASLLFPF